MYIHSELSKGHSKIIRDNIINYVGSDASRMKELMDCFFSDDLRINQRSAWPLSFIAIKHPDLIEPYHVKLAENLYHPHHDAVVRNTLRIYEDVPIPESIEGILCEKCFDFLMDTKAAWALRIFSITVLEKLVDRYPELKVELIAILEEHLPHGSAGFKNRGSKTLKRLLEK